MKTISITDATFDQEVLQSDKPVLVDLWAPWCGPCRLIGPVIEEIANETNDRFKITKVNIEEHPQIAQRFGVRAIPTMLFFKDGALSDKFVGVTPKKAIVAKLDSLTALDEAADEASLIS